MPWKYRTWYLPKGLWGTHTTRSKDPPHHSWVDYDGEIRNSYETCAWIIWCMFLGQCGGLRIDHRTALLVVTMPYTCWFLWWANCIEDFKSRLHFRIGVAFWRVVWREVYFEGPNHFWRALKTSILKIARGVQVDIFCLFLSKLKRYIMTMIDLQ
jgi:hypothetical protein